MSEVQVHEFISSLLYPTLLYIVQAVRHIFHSTNSSAALKRTNCERNQTGCFVSRKTCMHETVNGTVNSVAAFINCQLTETVYNNCKHLMSGQPITQGESS